jgi:predicted Zn finger-like uncharacterized protein
MKITCPSCSAKYTIADDKVRGRTVKIKCKKCGATISVGPEGEPEGATSQSPASTGSGGAEWLVNLGDGEQRSLSAQQIGELYLQGVISDDTYLWREGMSDWLPLASVPEVASTLPSRPPPGPDPADEMDDAMPTVMGPVPGFSPSAPAGPAAPRPAAGAPAVAAAPAPAAARRSAPKGRDLFAQREEENAGFAGNRASSPPPRPPAPGLMNSDEASGILDIRKLQGAMGSKPEAPKKDEKIDDIMNLGGGALFSSPIAPPDFSGPALSPPDFSAPPPPEPEPPRPAVAAMPMPVPMSVAPMVAEPPKKSKGLFIGIGAVAMLALGIGGTVLVMGGKKSPEEGDTKTTAAASADAEKKVAEAPKAEEKKDEPKAEPTSTAEKKADVEAEPPPGKELTPEEKKRREEAFKKKEEEKKKKKEDEEQKKKQQEEEEKKKKAEAETAAAANAPGGDKPFDRASANSALSSIASSVGSCKKGGDPSGTGKVAVTFAPSGKATTANVEGSFAGTSLGGCVAARFRAAKVPPFSGNPVTVRKTFTIN